MTIETGMQAAANTKAPKGVDAEKTLRTDCEIVGRIVGHLHVAARILVEGKVSTIEKIKHEMQRILHMIEMRVQEHAASIGTGMPADFYGADPGIPSLALPNANSVQAWNQAVGELLPDAMRLPNGKGCLPDRFKKDLADLIKQGRKFVGGGSNVASQAGEQVGKAARLYSNLSGVSYL